MALTAKEAYKIFHKHIDVNIDCNQHHPDKVKIEKRKTHNDVAIAKACVSYDEALRTFRAYSENTLWQTELKMINSRFIQEIQRLEGAVDAIEIGEGYYLLTKDSLIYSVEDLGNSLPKNVFSMNEIQDAICKSRNIRNHYQIPQRN